MKKVFLFVCCLLLASSCRTQSQVATTKGKPKTVMVSWAASASSGVTRQYIYRGTASGAEDYNNPIAVVNGNTVISYHDMDPAITTKHTYCYTLKSYNGALSNPSNESCVRMP